MTKMFPFITKTWNPLGGGCQHGCKYCYAADLIELYNMNCYRGPPCLRDNILKASFSDKEFVFVGDMNDLFGDWVPKDMIQRIIDESGFMSRAKYLFLTKNPRRYLGLSFTANMVLGITAESNRDYEYSLAPPPLDRLKIFAKVNHPAKMISVEPICDFDPDKFTNAILDVKPEFVAVGYDNHDKGLIEPSLEKTTALIADLKAAGIKVYLKTIREPKVLDQYATAIANGYTDGQAQTLATWTQEEFVIFINDMIRFDGKPKEWVFKKKGAR